MNNNDLKLLEDKVRACERKLEKMANLEERLEKCFQNVEKFRDKMIQNGYSYAMLEEFNKAIQPIVQHCNEMRKARKKIRDAEEAIRDAQKRDKEALRSRQEKLIEHVILTAAAPVYPFNTKCGHFSFSEGKEHCEVKMDMVYCGQNCPYATNQVCSNKVDGKGMTVAYKKRRIR